MRKIAGVTVMNATYVGILALFFCSGASALAYETLWQRQMLLAFGASAPATTAVLTSFFCGIAFGSLIGGRILRRYPNALKFYAAVELWIGVCALLLPFLMRGVESLYIPLAQSRAAEFHAAPPFFLARFAMAVLVVLPATLGMGATIPAMNRVLDEMKKQSIGANVGLAYGVNTLGAVAGGMLAGFVLIKAFGVEGSLHLAFGTNVLVFLGAAYLSRRFSFTTPAHAAKRLPRRYLWLAVIYFGAGVLALGFEILWLRVLGILATNGVYTFVLALAVYLLGFSLGSLFLFRQLARRLTALQIFFIANFGVGASALACIASAYWWPPIVTRQLLQTLEESGTLHLGHLALFESVYAFSLMFLPALFMGLAYPAVCQKLIEDKANVAEQSGTIYFIGNLGAMVGIAGTGLLIIPTLGLNATLGVFSAASVLLALLTVFLYPETFATRKRLAQGAGGLVLVLSIAYVAMAPPFLRGGNAVYDSQRNGWREQFSRKTARGLDILRYQAGASATIIVKEARYPDSGGPIRTLYVDDQPVAATSLSMVIDAKMLAHIPLLLHPRPSKALTVGFGSGGTSHSMTVHGIDTYAVEIEPEVVRSAGLFADVNHNVTTSAAFRLILNDARDHLRTTKGRYDVISTDVTNLQYKQNASLYSREYFRLMKQSLGDGGIACAWIPLKGIDTDELRILMRTFRSVFPHATLWFMDNAEMRFGILIGTPGPLRLNVKRFREAFAVPAVQRDLAQVGIEDPHQIMNFMYLDEEGYRTFAGSGPLHTDDRPILEFSSPMSFYLLGDVLYSLTERWDSLRAGSFLPHLEDATDEEKKAYARDERFYRLLGSANRRIFLKPYSRSDRISDLETSARQLDDALELRPGDSRAVQAKKEIESELNMLRALRGRH